jgi:predicted DsbA family dithiol-disulfide isomerase
MEPLIAIFVSENLDINYDKIDVSDEFDPAVEYGVKGVPTFIALVDGIETARHTGIATKETLLNLFS